MGYIRCSIYGTRGGRLDSLELQRCPASLIGDEQAAEIPNQALVPAIYRY